MEGWDEKENWEVGDNTRFSFFAGRDSDNTYQKTSKLIFREYHTQ